MKIAVCVPATTTSTQISMANNALRMIGAKYNNVTAEMFGDSTRELVKEIVEKVSKTFNQSGIIGCMNASAIASECEYAILLEGSHDETIDTVCHSMKVDGKRFYFISRSNNIEVIQKDSDKYGDIKSKIHMYSAPMFTGVSDGLKDGKAASPNECPLNLRTSYIVSMVVAPVVYWKERNDIDNAQKAIDYSISRGELSPESTMDNLVFLNQWPKCECGKCTAALSTIKKGI